MKKILKKIVFNVFQFIPVNKKIITFESYCGKKISDNPKAIYDEIKKRRTKYKCIWFVTKNTDVSILPKKEIIRKGTIRWLYYTVISGTWIKNTGEYGDLKKRKSQLYIQTWHGIPIKKMGLDVSKNNISTTAKEWDYVISPGTFYNLCLNSAYKLDLVYLNFGYPRNDIFFKNNIKKIENIKLKLNIDKNKKIILYAPTFRDNEKVETTKKIEDFLKLVPKEYKVLYRVHPHRKFKNSNSKKIIDVSNYNDISDLMLISDILITDYSSVFFDYLNLNKPIIFYAYDLDNYRDKERGFYLEYDSVPGPIAKNSVELIAEINDLNNYWKKYNKKYKEFKKKYNEFDDGNASKLFVDWLFKEINK